jgi:hypothetical protein
MKSLQRTASFLALALLVLTPVGAALAADDGDEKMKTTLIGQLSQDAGGAYVLVEQESGDQVALEGAAEDLAQHIGAKVKVSGEWAKDPEGNEIFRVSEVEPAA